MTFPFLSNLPNTPPIGAVRDEEFIRRIRALCLRIPEDHELLRTLALELEQHEHHASIDFVLDTLSHTLRTAALQHASHPKLSTYHIPALARRFLAPDDIAYICTRLLNGVDTRARLAAYEGLSAINATVVSPAKYPEMAWDASNLIPRTWEDLIPSSLIREEKTKALRLPRFKTVARLRAFLHVSSQETFERIIRGAYDNGTSYTQFTIPKRNGTPRTICAPEPELKRIQREIYASILKSIPTHDAAHGFVQGRSIVTNARPHVGRALVIKFDLQNFFPSIHTMRVLGFFQSLGYHGSYSSMACEDASSNIAMTLTHLTTFIPQRPRHAEYTRLLGTTPQGAPTSPVIANLICRRLDRRLTGLATALGGQYTRYADDLTFSFDAEPSRGIGRFRWWVEHICVQEGFTPHPAKFRVLRPSQRQIVTGLVVNDTLRVPRTTRRRIRATLHNCKLYGVSSQSNGDPNFLDTLDGMIHFIHMVHPEEGRALRSDFNALRRGVL